MKLPFYSQAEERLNFISHLIGTIVSAIGLLFLVKWGYEHGDNGVFLGFVIFGFASTFTFLASTLYHGVSTRKLKKQMRLVDHSAIYIMIAGSYSPFTLGNLREDWGLLLFALVWTLAIGGIIFKYVVRHKMDSLEKLDTILYVILGMLVVLFLRPAFDHISSWGIFFLALGGAFYLVGVVFYLWKKLPYNHAIWHLWVMAGAATHFFSVAYYVNPPV